MLSLKLCTQFLEAETPPTLQWPPYPSGTSPIEHVPDRRVRQRAPVPERIPELGSAQSIIFILCEGDALHNEPTHTIEHSLLVSVMCLFNTPTLFGYM